MQLTIPKILYVYKLIINFFTYNVNTLHNVKVTENHLPLNQNNSFYGSCFCYSNYCKHIFNKYLIYEFIKF